MHNTSTSLLDRLKHAGNEDAWQRFVDLYTPLLYLWARQIGLQPSDAADLVQDVLSLLVVKLPEFHYDPSRSFRAWLRTVTLNKWRENHRRADVIARADARDLPTIAEPDNVAHFWNQEYRQHLVERATQLMRAEFQPVTWKAFWETVTHARPPAEVARELGISVNAVYIARSRVLHRLKQELNGLLE